MTGAKAPLDVFGEVYAALSEGQAVSTVVMATSVAGVPGRGGTSWSWYEVPGYMPGSPITVVGGYEIAVKDAAWPEWVVFARGGQTYEDRGWVDIADPARGRLGPAPYPFVPCRGDALGRGVLSPADLEPSGGAIDPGQGDHVVLVRCLSQRPRLLWTRDEPGKPRVAPGSNPPRLLVGDGPVLLGGFAPATLYRLNPPPAGYAPGDFLPGNPDNPDGVALLRTGEPGAKGRPVGPVLAVGAGTLVPDLDFSSFPGAPAAVVEPSTGRCVVRPEAVRAGESLWYTPLQFRSAGTGAVAPAGGRRYLAPVPEVGEVPYLRVGERLPLEVQVVPTEADLEQVSGLDPGSAVVARTTGRVLLSEADQALLDAGASLFYLGAFLGSAEVTASPIPPGVGHRQVGAGSLLGGKAGMLLKSTGDLSLLDGVGKPLVQVRFGPPLAVFEVDVDAALPLRSPEGQAVVSRQSGKIALPPSVTADDPLWVTSTTAMLRRFDTGPQLRSMVRHTFQLDGTEKLYLAVSGQLVVWDAAKIGAAPLSAAQAADSLGKLLSPFGGAAAEDRGCVVMKAPPGGWIEVLYGPDPRTPDLSGAATLGFCPGWRAASSSGGPGPIDLGIAVGLPSDGVELARRFRGNVRDPVDPVPVVVLSTKPLEEDPGLPRGDAFGLERGGDRIPVRVGVDASYDSSGGRLIWATRNVVEVEAPGSVARAPLAGHIPGSLKVEMEGRGVLVQGEDFVLDAAGLGEVRLVEQVAPAACGGTSGQVSANPPAIEDPGISPACVRPGASLRAGLGWYRVEKVSGNQAFLDRAPAPEDVGRSVSWVATSAPSGPLDPSILADVTLIPVDYRGAYDLVLSRVDPGKAPVALSVGQDFELDPSSGLVALTAPLPQKSRMLAAGYAADAAGFRGAPFNAELDVAEVRSQARRVSVAEFRFGEQGPPPDADKLPSVQVRIRGAVRDRSDARVDYPPDLGGAGRIMFLSDAPSEDAVVEVRYRSREAVGGERLLQLPVNPVFASFVRLPAGQSYVGLRGDHSNQISPGCLLRVAASCFWVKKVTYYPPRPGGGDATRVDIFPTPEVDSGSRGPADRINLLCSDRPLMDDPLTWVAVEVVEPLAPGSSRLELAGILPGQRVQPGCILDLGGHPYTVAGADMVGDRAKVTLTSALSRGAVAAVAAQPCRISARPAYPPGATVFAGPRFVGSPEVILWLRGVPGRSLGPEEVRADEVTGEVRLLKMTLAGGAQVTVRGRALAPAPLGDPPRLKISFLRMYLPSFEPGDRVVGSYLYYRPDILRFSVGTALILRVLTRADIARQAEVADAEAAERVAWLAETGRRLAATLGVPPSPLPVPGQDSFRRVAMGRDAGLREEVPDQIAPRRVRATVDPLRVPQGSDPWVLVGRLAASGSPVERVLKARAWAGDRVLGMGVDIDVDADGTVYLPAQNLGLLGRVVVDAQVDPQVIVPPEFLGIPTEIVEPLRLLSQGMSLVAADRRVMGAGMRVCLGRGSMGPDGLLRLSPDTPAAQILPGDVLLFGSAERYRVRAVPRGADPGRWAGRCNPRANPPFSEASTLVVEPLEGARMSSGVEREFSVLRTWEHVAAVMLAPRVEQALEQVEGQIAAALDLHHQAVTSKLEELDKFARRVLETRVAQRDALRRSVEGTPYLYELAEPVQEDSVGLPDLLHVVRPGGPYHTMALETLRRRYDPTHGTLAALLRCRSLS